MNLGVDISQIIYKGTGVSRFTEGLTNAILNDDKKNNWLFFFSSLRKNLDNDLEKKIKQKGHRLIKWKIPPTLLSFFSNNLHNLSPLSIFYFPFSKSLDWFITSDWTEPPMTGINKTTIVHDLVYLRYPETVDKKIKKTQEQRLKWVRSKSKIIFADSQTTKNDLISLLKIDHKKITVNYPGIDVILPNKEQIKQTLTKHRLTRPFILTVGKIEPRKNLMRLLEAFNRLNNKNIDLVIVGIKGWDVSINQLIKTGSIKNVHFLGFVNDEELNSLYSSCLFFAYPSLYEGFGYPVAEAMSIGAPVTTSNTSSLKEITEDSALLFNPFDINDIAKKMKTLITNKNLREELIKKGKKQSDQFTWKKYYEKMINTLKSY